MSYNSEVMKLYNDDSKIKITVSETLIDKLSKGQIEAIRKIVSKATVEFSSKQDKMQEFYMRYTGNSVPVHKRSYPDYVSNFERNKVHHDFEKEIVNTKVNYLFNRPLVRNTKNENLKTFDFDNNVEKFDAEMCKMSAICGYGSALLYIPKTDKALVKILEVNPWEAIFIKDGFDNVVAAIRTWWDDDLHQNIEYYDSKNIYYIKSEIDKEKTEATFKFNDLIPHGFDYIPLIQCKNNKETISDIFPVVDQIDAYDNSVSDLLNELIGQRNAIMICSVPIEKKAKDDIQKTGAAIIPEGAEIKYLLKDINKDNYQYLQDNLKADIARFSGTPDFTDLEKTGNLTNLGISFLYSKLDHRAGSFKREYISFLRELYKCAESATSKTGKKFEIKEITFLWTENKPFNSLEAADAQQKLKGIVSDVFRLSQHPDIANPQKEKEELEKDMNESINREKDLLGFDSEGQNEENI